MWACVSVCSKWEDRRRCTRLTFSLPYWIPPSYAAPPLLRTSRLPAWPRTSPGNAWASVSSTPTLCKEIETCPFLNGIEEQLAALQAALAAETAARIAADNAEREARSAAIQAAIEAEAAARQAAIEAEAQVRAAEDAVIRVSKMKAKGRRAGVLSWGRWWLYPWPMQGIFGSPAFTTDRCLSQALLPAAARYKGANGGSIILPST